MARIPEEVTRAVREATDIVDVVSRYVELRRAGASFKALCPFHEEKTPSFHVHPHTQRYKCFGCGEGGDVISFLMLRRNQSFREVVEDLARDASIELPEETSGEHDDGSRRRDALRALEFAAGFFRAVLKRPAAAEAAAYLDGRGFAPETLQDFELGYAPGNWDDLLKYARSKGFSEAALLDAGLARRRDDGRPYDAFRNRIVFPIRDLSERVVGFGARAMGDDQPKYLNSPETLAFRKSRELYALPQARDAARKSGRIILVEGYTDVLMCHQVGIREAVATLGTALTPDHAKVLRRFDVPVVLLYDGDEAGITAAERGAEILLAEGVQGSVALLEGGQDPADLLRDAGPDALEAILGRARELLEFRIDRARARHDVATLAGRMGGAEEVLRAIIKTSADFMVKDTACRLVAERIEVPESALRDRVGDLLRKASAPRPGQDRSSRRPGPEEGPAERRWSIAERDFLRGALFHDRLWDEVAGIHPAGAFQDPLLREIADAVNDVRESGHPVSADALAERLSDEAARALFELEDLPELEERVRMHLSRIADDDRRRRAREAADPLAAMVEARRRDAGASPEEWTGSGDPQETR